MAGDAWNSLIEQEETKATEGSVVLVFFVYGTLQCIRRLLRHPAEIDHSFRQTKAGRRCFATILAWNEHAVK